MHPEVTILAKRTHGMGLMVVTQPVTALRLTNIHGFTHNPSLCLYAHYRKFYGHLNHE
jgi:hypothetical protein